MVISWIFAGSTPHADRYGELIGDRRITVAFQTVMEVRFGAIVAGWGDFRRRRLEYHLRQYSLMEADDDLATVCAQLRARCVRTGHPLGDKVHDGDRWIAAAAIRLGVPLVSHDGVFEDAPGLELLSLRGTV